MFKSLRWRLAIPYVGLILVATLGLTVFISRQVREAQLADLQNQLLAEARVLADGAGLVLSGGQDPDALDSLAARWADLVDARVTLIALDGTVLADSHHDASLMDNHGDRPEVRDALEAGQGIAVRHSSTMNAKRMYAAVPLVLEDGGEPYGVARVSLSVGQIEATAGRLRDAIVVSGCIMALLAAALALIIAERTARPVRKLTEAAERMAEGDLSGRLHPVTDDEIGQLTRALDHMAGQLRTEVTRLAEERGRLEAVLAHMADGVLITDETGTVRLVNPAATRLLDTTEVKALDRSFAQVVPHHQLIDLWRRCRESGLEQVETVEIGSHDLFLHAIVTPFMESGAGGDLVILQDLTRVRRLETVRRDFISNISHELRTPLAGLKAIVDTLQAGALKDRSAAKRFLRRMDMEVDALSQMVQELLELSRIESGLVPVRLTPTSVASFVEPPLDRLRHQAERAGLELSLELPPDIPEVLADLGRIQQVITNLVHNALKFTSPGGAVIVSARDDGDDVVILVQDSGVGIPESDLPRIFERFYKADRARSGGGTGLGLAISKHIVQGHGGRIWAESTEGQGSTFHFTLPKAK